MPGQQKDNTEESTQTRDLSAGYVAYQLENVLAKNIHVLSDKTHPPQVVNS